MATIEGNEIALRKVAAELMPPVRNGQDAKTNQDDFGTPFVTKTYELLNTYQVVVNPPSGPAFLGPQESLAPSWCYGLMLDSEGAVGGNIGPYASSVRFFASFGDRNQIGTNEVEISPGKVLMFPRGARRVFLRHNAGTIGSLQAPAIPANVTWIVDRFASLQSAGDTGLQVTRSWLGDLQQGFDDSQSTPTPSFGIGGYEHVNIVFRNNSNQIYNYSTEASVFGSTQTLVIDSGTIPVGAMRMISYGPGVQNTNPPNSTGHGFVLPAGATINFSPAGGPVFGQINWSIRGV